MSKNAFRKKVETRLAQACAASMDFNVPLEFENVRFNPTATMYASLKILEGQSFQTELKARAITRVPGVLQIDCLAPEDEASTGLDNLSHFVGKVFDRQSFFLIDGSRVVFRTPYGRYLGKSNGWCRNVVSIDYYRDEAPALPGEN